MRWPTGTRPTPRCRLPPTCLDGVHRSLHRAAVAAMRSDARMTMVEWPSENHNPLPRALPVVDQLTDHVVDGCDVIGIDRVASPNTQASSAMPSSAGRSWKPPRPRSRLRCWRRSGRHTARGPEGRRSPPTMPLTRRGPQIEVRLERAIPAVRRARGAATHTRPACPRRFRLTTAAPRCRGLICARVTRCSAPRRNAHSGSRSILLISINRQARNMCGYLSGLSSPSVTESITTLARSPRSNSAGHTRLPTFSISTTEPRAASSCCSAARHHVARRDGSRYRC